MTDQTAVETDAIHAHFGLSHANYLVLPRTLLQSMPDRWQTQFVGLLGEMTEAFQDVPQAEAYKVEAATEQIVNEMTHDQLFAAGIEVENDDPDYGPGPDTRYHSTADGRDVEPNERVLLPVPDPVPHYNRGRTRIAPKLPARGEGELCPFGEGDAPGSGCILPAGHEPANRHLVTPGDTGRDL
ncbi:hypothetical protein [Streptomyces olivaceus]